MITRSTLLALAVMLVLGAVASGAPSWNAPVQLSTGDRAVGPELALNAGGEALVVWDQEVGADCPTQPPSLSCVHIVTAAARAAGSAVWAAPIEISRPGVGAEPRAALDGLGDGALLWIHDIGRDRVVQATYRHGSAGTWPEPNDISEASLEVRDHEIALDPVGNAVAVWAERRDATFDVYAAVRSAVVGGWRAPTRLSGESHVVSGPDLELTRSGRAVVAWVDGSNMLRVVAGDVSTGAWDAPGTAAVQGGLAKRGPRIASNEAGDTAVVWFTGEQGSAGRRIWRAVRPRGADWRAPQPFDSAGSPAVAPSVAIDEAGTVAATWLAPEGIATAIGALTSDWKAARMAPRTSSASDPRLALDVAGNAAVAWATGGDQSALLTSIAPASSGSWEPPTTVARAEGSGPRLAIAPRGRAVVVWSVGAAARVSVESADLGGEGPVLDRLALPPRALIVHVRGRFSAHALPWAAALADEPRWTFGDGSSASGTHVGHSYARPGLYKVTVSQSDSAGGVSTSRGTVTVVRERVRTTRPPWIQGLPLVGRTLTCRRGTWSGSPPIRFTYAWRRDGQYVAKRTQRTFRLGKLDLGSLIACEVVATNPAGSVRAISAVVGVER